MASNSTHARELKDQATETLTEDYEALKDNFSQLRTDVVDLLSHAFGLGKSSANSIGSSVKHQASDAVDTLKDQISNLRKQGGDQVHAVGKRIEDNPIASTAIAFGVGFVLAKLMSRK